jgi:4-amino-4-deoxy-L-arabinose transferase-like glycosyltransferase
MTTSASQLQTGTTDQQGRWLLWLSLAAVAAAFIARLLGIVEPMGPDQGVYATIGWGLQRGLTLYRDLWDLKPPGIYLTYLFGFDLFGARETSIFWLDYLAGALTALVTFDFGRRLLGIRFGALAAAAFALGTLPAARHAYGGFLERAIAEKFITLLAAACAWATVMAVTRRRDGWSFGAGVLVGVAAVFKPFALVYWPASILWTWFATDTARARRFAAISAIGLVVAPLAAFAWLAAEGVLSDAWVALVQFNRAYLAVGGHGIAYILDRFAHEIWVRVRSDEVWGFGSLSAVAALGAWRWRATRPGWVASLGIAWLGAALVAIPANGPRMFMTYFVPPLFPLCLLSAWLLDRTLGSVRRRNLAAGLLLLGVLGVMVVRSGSLNRAVSITRWDARHLAGSTTRGQYLQRFRSRNEQGFSATDNARLADYIRAHTDPRDRIFVFGMTGGTYFSSGRLPASRFLFVYPAVSDMIDRPEFHVAGLAAELGRTAPRYIVLQRHNRDSFSGWRAEDSFAAPPMAELLRGYRQETEIGDFLLYRRNDGRP